MVGRVLSHEVDEWHLSPVSVVQIRESVAKTRAQMKKRTRRLLGHPCIPICSAGYDSFKEPKNATHFWYVVEGGDDMNFRGAWVRETNVDIRRH